MLLTWNGNGPLISRRIGKPKSKNNHLYSLFLSFFKYSTSFYFFVLTVLQYSHTIHTNSLAAVLRCCVVKVTPLKKNLFFLFLTHLHNKDDFDSLFFYLFFYTRILCLLLLAFFFLGTMRLHIRVFFFCSEILYLEEDQECRKSL